MTRKNYVWLMLVLSLAGASFSGYISGVKFFSETCAFNQPCPYFLGYPSCYYGFAMFLALLISTIVLFLRGANTRKVVRFNTIVSALGVVFALYFSYPEIRGMIQGTFNSYFMGLSTCVYGMLFFISAYIISLVALRKNVS